MMPSTHPDPCDSSGQDAATDRARALLDIEAQRSAALIAEDATHAGRLADETGRHAEALAHIGNWYSDALARTGREFGLPALELAAWQRMFLRRLAQLDSERGEPGWYTLPIIYQPGKVSPAAAADARSLVRSGLLEERQDGGRHAYALTSEARASLTGRPLSVAGGQR